MTVCPIFTKGGFPLNEGVIERADTNPGELPKLLEKCLIVEDNLFIAIDAEDLIRSIGAGSVHVAKSLKQAIDAIEKEKFTFAFLDVNLGNENSLPAARLLKTRAIPFAFTTGYGDGLAISDVSFDVPVIAKPYSQAAMAEALLAFTTSRVDTAANPSECRKS